MASKIQDIQKLIDQGAFEQAHEKINEILELGPYNIQALKFKALLFGVQGMFRQERKVWKEIAEIDPEDNSVLQYFYRSFIEEKEFEYFTDHLPQGGRRYLANPRAMVNPSFIGLLGCSIFLILSNLSRTHLILATPFVSMTLFLLLVLGPWLLIISTYIRSLRDVILTTQGITVRTRMATHSLQWSDLESVYILTELPYSSGSIRLVMKPRLASQKALVLEIGEDATVRAPSFMVEDVTRLFQKPVHLSSEKLPLSKGNSLSF